MLEKDIERIILNELNKSGLGFFWKNASVGVYDAKKGSFRKPGAFQIRGVSDIIGVTRDGRACFFEVKTKTGRLSKYQANFIEKMEYWNAIVGVVRCTQDAFDLLNKKL